MCVPCFIIVPVFHHFYVRNVQVPSKLLSRNLSRYRRFLYRIKKHKISFLHFDLAQVGQINLTHETFDITRANILQLLQVCNYEEYHIHHYNNREKSAYCRLLILLIILKIELDRLTKQIVRFQKIQHRVFFNLALFVFFFFVHFYLKFLL